MLCRLRLGLLEQDLAYRYGVSQPTVSRIITTWLNFCYSKFKEVPIWPSREIGDNNMPKFLETCIGRPGASLMLRKFLLKSRKTLLHSNLHFESTKIITHLKP